MTPTNETVSVSMERPWEAQTLEEAKRALGSHRADVRAVMLWLARCLHYAAWLHDKEKNDAPEGYFAALAEAREMEIPPQDTELYAENAFRDRSTLHLHARESLNLIDVLEFVADRALAGDTEATLDKDILAAALANTFAFVKTHLRTSAQKTQDSNNHGGTK